MKAHEQNPRPKFRKDRKYQEAMDILKKAQNKLVGRQKRSRCLFPLSEDGCCGERAIGGHTIQKALLSRMERTGRVQGFLRDVANMGWRITDFRRDDSKSFYDQRRWSPTDVRIGDASVHYFTCDLHDTVLFVPIERGEENSSTHPLDAPELTNEHYFLLAYRRLMVAIEQLERVKIMLNCIKEQYRNDKRLLLTLMRINGYMKGLTKAKESFDECYLRRGFDDFIDTPVDAILELPLKVAVADLYLFNDMDEVFLTIFPFHPSRSEENGLYNHRVIASRMKTAPSSTQGAIDKIHSMVESLGTDNGGLEEFLREVLTKCQNSFFSHDYEQLPDHIRETIERAVYCAAVQDIPEPLRGYLMNTHGEDMPLGGSSGGVV